MPKLEIILKGRSYFVPDKQAKALVEHGVAKFPEAKAMTYQTRALKAETSVEPTELSVARADYEAALGKKPYYGWDVETLREKIADAKAEDEVESLE